MVAIVKLNPLYHYINCMRCLVMYGTGARPQHLVCLHRLCCGRDGGSLAAFRKLQRNFILYL